MVKLKRSQNAPLIINCVTSDMDRDGIPVESRSSQGSVGVIYAQGPPLWSRRRSTLAPFTDSRVPEAGTHDDDGDDEGYQGPFFKGFPGGYQLQTLVVSNTMASFPNLSNLSNLSSLTIRHAPTRRRLPTSSKFPHQPLDGLSPTPNPYPLGRQPRPLVAPA